MKDIFRVDSVVGLTLDELLKQEEIILFDSSIINLQAFSDEYSCQFLGFNPDMLSGDCDLVDEAINFLEDKENKCKVYTIEKAVTEQEGTLSLLDGVIQRINYKITQNKKNHSKYKIIKDENLNQLTSLKGKVGKFIRLSRRHVYQPKMQTPYNLISSLINQLGRYVKRKRDRHEKFRRLKKSYGKKKDIRTDEEILATAYFLLLFEKKTCAIITMDTDFTTMIPIIHGLLTAKDIHSDIFKNVENNINLYLPAENQAEGRYILKSATSGIEPIEKFVIYNLPYDRSSNVKKHVENELTKIQNYLRH